MPVITYNYLITFIIEFSYYFLTVINVFDLTANKCRNICGFQPLMGFGLCDHLPTIMAFGQ